MNDLRFSLPLAHYYRYTYHESPYHEGQMKDAIDFVVEEGTPVVAAADGEILDVADRSTRGGPGPENEEYGNYVEIRHEGGIVSEYEHLQPRSARFQIGDPVTRGTPIASSGATGVLATLGPHLHFMVGYYDWRGIDFQTVPILWVEEPQRSKGGVR